MKKFFLNGIDKRKKEAYDSKREKRKIKKDKPILQKRPAIKSQAKNGKKSKKFF